MRYCSFLLLVCGMGATTIQDSIRDASGTPVSGSCVISAAVPFSTPSPGFRVVGQPVTVTFNAGAFKVNLVPTDTAQGGAQYYLASCRNIVGTWQKQNEVWLVPTSATPLSIAQVAAASAPNNQLIPWSQLASGGAQPGQVMVWNGSTWALGSVGTNPMTQPNDMIVGGAGGAPVALHAGASNQFLSQGAYRALVPTDIPALDASAIATGTFNSARIPVIPPALGGLGANTSALSGVLVLTNGAPATVTGTATNCVLVNGTSGPCGAGGGGPQTWQSLLMYTWGQLIGQ
jgi:hypothetical protein